MRPELAESLELIHVLVDQLERPLGEHVEGVSLGVVLEGQHLVEETGVSLPGVYFIV